MNGVFFLLYRYPAEFRERPAQTSQRSAIGDNRSVLRHSRHLPPRSSRSGFDVEQLDLENQRLIRPHHLPGTLRTVCQFGGKIKNIFGAQRHQLHPFDDPRDQIPQRSIHRPALFLGRIDHRSVRTFHRIIDTDNILRGRFGPFALLFHPILQTAGGRPNSGLFPIGIQKSLAGLFERLRLFPPPSFLSTLQNPVGFLFVHTSGLSVQTLRNRFEKQIPIQLLSQFVGPLRTHEAGPDQPPHGIGKRIGRTRPYSRGLFRRHRPKYRHHSQTTGNQPDPYDFFHLFLLLSNETKDRKISASTTLFEDISLF